MVSPPQLILHSKNSSRPKYATGLPFFSAGLNCQEVNASLHRGFDQGCVGATLRQTTSPDVPTGRSTVAVPLMSAFRIKPLKWIWWRARAFVSLELNVSRFPVIVIRRGYGTAE